VVTDVESSTRAVEAGRYQLVNLAGAAGIAAVCNICRGETIPFLFGGDGAVLLVPPGRVQSARVALVRTCAFARTTYGLTLRAGAMSVGEIRRRGRDVLVARYEPTPGNSFGLFWAAACNCWKLRSRGATRHYRHTRLRSMTSMTVAPPISAGCRAAGRR
jgi:hypothetical protein